MARHADAVLANSHFGAERLRAAYGRNAAVITHGSDFSPAVRIRNPKRTGTIQPRRQNRFSHGQFSAPAQAY